MSFNKNKKRKKPPGAGGCRSAVPPSSGGRCPGPVRTRQAPPGGVRAVGGLQFCPPRPGGAKQSPPSLGSRLCPTPPPISWVVLGFVSLGRSQTSKAAAGSGGSTAPPRAGAGGWGLPPPQLCVELLQPRGGGSEGLAGTGPQLPPPKTHLGPGAVLGPREGGGSSISHHRFLLPSCPPPFFFSPSPPRLPCTCLGFLCVFHSVRHGSINQKPLPAPCPLSPAPSRCPSCRSPRAPQHRTASESKKVYLATNQKLDS